MTVIVMYISLCEYKSNLYIVHLKLVLYVNYLLKNENTFYLKKRLRVCYVNFISKYTHIHKAWGTELDARYKEMRKIDKFSVFVDF